MHWTVYFCHISYALLSESALYTCLNVKELLAQSRREIWSLSGCSWTRTHNHLVHKRTVDYFSKLVKWMTCILSSSLYGAFDGMFLSCHVQVSEWIHTLEFPEYQGTPSSKQARNLQFRWLQLNSKQQPLSSSTNTQPFSETGQMIELCWEYSSVRSIWHYVFVMWYTNFKVNRHSIVAWMWGNSLLKVAAKSEV